MSKKWRKIANEYVVSLFPVFMMVDAVFSGMKKMVGLACNLFFKIEGGAAEYYCLPTNWEQVHWRLVTKIKKDPDFLRRIFLEIDKKGRQQIVSIKKLTQNLSKKSNQALNEIYQNYILTNTYIYSLGLTLPLLDYQETTFFSDELKKILKSKKSEDYFNISTIPLKETFNQRQELDLLKILIRIEKNKNLKNNFLKSDYSELIRLIKRSYPVIWRLLAKHTKNYCWVNYVYEGPAADEAYFIDLLRDSLRRKINPVKELAEYQKNKIELKNKQKEIIKKLALNNYEKSIFELTRDVVFYKAYRRELQSHSYYYMESVLREISKRLGLSLSQVRMMLPKQITLALLKNKINFNFINERLRFVVYGRQKHSFCLIGSAAKEFFKNNIYIEKTIKKVREFSGSTAYAGRARGRVKIINMPSQMEKMANGDILVAVTTNPNLMPAIRKAAAIVTEEGGLTCHAAIVSRELKTPCVVGTKIATKVLKDGDLVEVDATKGVVKKI